MKSKVNSKYTLTLKSIIEDLNYQIFYSFSRGKSCTLYIALFDSNAKYDIFLNDLLLYSGTESMCKKLFNDIKKLLKKGKYNLDGNSKEFIIIKYKKERKALKL